MHKRRPHPHSSTFNLQHSFLHSLSDPSPSSSFTFTYDLTIFILCCSTHKIQRKIKNKNLAMAAQKCMISIIGAMDRLWFHQIILFSDPSSFRAAEDAQKPSQSLPNSSNHSFLTQQLSPLAPPRVSSCTNTHTTTVTDVCMLWFLLCVEVCCWWCL